jgi:hypothetical protein
MDPDGAHKFRQNLKKLQTKVAFRRLTRWIRRKLVWASAEFREVHGGILL